MHVPFPPQLVSKHTMPGGQRRSAPRHAKMSHRDTARIFDCLAGMVAEHSVLALHEASSCFLMHSLSKEVN